MNQYNVIGKRIGFNAIYGSDFNKMVEATTEENAREIVNNVYPAVEIISIELVGEETPVTVYEWNDSPIDPQEFNVDSYVFWYFFCGQIGKAD